MIRIPLGTGMHRLSSRRSPAKRVRWGEDEQRNVRMFGAKRRTEQNGVCEDEKPPSARRANFGHRNRPSVRPCRHVFFDRRGGYQPPAYPGSIRRDDGFWRRAVQEAGPYDGVRYSGRLIAAPTELLWPCVHNFFCLRSRHLSHSLFTFHHSLFTVRGRLIAAPTNVCWKCVYYAVICPCASSPHPSWRNSTGRNRGCTHSPRSTQPRRWE